MFCWITSNWTNYCIKIHCFLFHHHFFANYQPYQFIDWPTTTQKSNKIVHKERPLSPAKRTEPTISVHTSSPIREPHEYQTHQNCRTQNGSMSVRKSTWRTSAWMPRAPHTRRSTSCLVGWRLGGDGDGFLRPKTGMVWNFWNDVMGLEWFFGRKHCLMWFNHVESCSTKNNGRFYPTEITV